MVAAGPVLHSLFFPLILLRISRTSIGNGRQRYAGSGLYALELLLS